METTRTQAADSSFKDLIGIIWRQKWVLAITLTIAILAAVGFMFIIEPTYQSSVRLVVEGRTSANTQIQNKESSVMGQFTIATPLDVPTQIEQLQSRMVLMSALETIRAANPAIAPKSPDDVEVTGRQMGLTNGIEITVTSPSEELSRQVAAQIPETFKTILQERNSGELNTAVAFVSSKLGTEQDVLAGFEKDFDSFRKSKNIPPSQTAAADISATYLSAQQRNNVALGDADAAQRALDSVQRARAALPPTIDSRSVAAPIDQAQLTRDRISQIEARILNLKVTYLEDSREVREARAELDKAKDFLRNLPPNYDNGLKIRNPLIEAYDQQVEQAKANKEAADARLRRASEYEAETKKRLEEYTNIVAELSQKQTAIELKKASVAQLTKQLNDLGLFVNQIRNPIQVIQDPSDPVKNRPNPPLYIAIALFVGTILAGAITLAKDRLEDRVSNLEQAFRLSGAPTLGYVPPTSGTKQLPVKSGVHALPGRVLENYRIIRSNVMFALKESQDRLVIITSTNASEGSPEVAANLATALAASGKSTLLLDANLYSPSQHTRLNVPVSPGLSDLLATGCDISTVIQPTSTPNLSFMGAGTAEMASGDLLGSEHMEQIFQSLREKYDLIIIDSPSMMPRSDTLALSSIADAIVYVVKPGQTSKSTMRYCIELLKHTRARLIGLVFTDTTFSAD